MRPQSSRVGFAFLNMKFGAVGFVCMFVSFVTL